MPTDLQKLQGTWRVVSLETDGRSLPDAALTDARVVVDGTRFQSLGMGATYEGTLRLRAAAGKTKGFDLVFTAGHAQGHTNLGIYVLDGDRWTLCLATRGTKRPRSFGTTVGSGFALETLERVIAGARRGARGRPAAKPSRATKPSAVRDAVAAEELTGSGEATPLEGDWAMVSGTFDGTPMHADMVAWVRRITRGNLTTVVAGPQPQLKARFTLDDAQKPLAIDYVNLHGASKGKKQAGIYALRADLLTICMAAPGKPRPHEFVSKHGDGRSLTVWRRLER